MGIVGRGTIAFFMMDSVGGVIFLNENVRSIVFMAAGLSLMILTARNSDRRLVFNTNFASSQMQETRGSVPAGHCEGTGGSLEGRGSHFPRFP